MNEQIQGQQENEKTVDYAVYAESAAQLYSDFFSDATRKRQGQLLISAILLILISHSFIDFTQGSLGGATFTVPDTLVLVWIARILCFYFVLVYMLGVLQDYQAFAFKERLIKYKIEKFMEQLKDKNLPIEDIVDKYIKEEWVREEWRKMITSSVIEVASAAPLGIAGSLSILKTMVSFAAREKPSEEQYQRGNLTKGLIIEKYKSFSIVRNALEIGFPAILGFFALWFSFI